MAGLDGVYHFSVQQVKVGPRTSLAHGCIVHGPSEIGEGCFVGFRAAVHHAQLADGVFVGTGAVVQNVKLGANALVPPAMAILSQTQADQAETTTQAEISFMEEVVNANLAMVKGYLSKNT